MLATTLTAHGPNLLTRLLDAKSPQQVDDYAKAAWVLNGEGLIADAEMAYLAPIIEHQRKITSNRVPTRLVSFMPTLTRRRRAAIPPSKRSASWLRRRGLAKDCIIPTYLAKCFTTGKLAVLAVIARTVIERGTSNMSLTEIAAKAGVGCTTARYAIREASRMGLISVRENRLNATWSRPNTIQIICKRWCDWLRACGSKVAKVRPKECAPEKGEVTPLRNLNPTLEKDRFKSNEAAKPKPATYDGFVRKLDRCADPPALAEFFRLSARF